MRSRQDSKADAIAHVPLFAAASKSDLKKIAAITDEIDIREGKDLTRQDAPGHEFFVLVEGTADVRRNGRKVRTLGPGDFFGEIALIANTPRTATVVAKTPLRTLVITDRAFRALMDKMPELQGKVMQVLAERLNSTVL